jgi:hypothetical protein
VLTWLLEMALERSDLEWRWLCWLHNSQTFVAGYGWMLHSFCRSFFAAIAGIAAYACKL